MPNKYFVQLGLKINGRIVKNEQYDAIEFVEKIFVVPKIKISFIDFILGRSNIIFGKYFDSIKENLKFNIISLIDADKFGKKKR